ncbi:hypothetical protein KXR53_20670 [Inquilinus limosus]|uniref:hypothetical protein n=1 Tax=Inquilinus limosus TaxID=171674 RepID=UPI003F18FEDB
MSWLILYLLSPRPVPKAPVSGFYTIKPDARQRSQQFLRRIGDASCHEGVIAIRRRLCEMLIIVALGFVACEAAFS